LLPLFQGSLEFVHRYLIPDVLRAFGQTKIGGVFVVDSLLNMNATEGSQEVTKDMKEMIPNFSAAVKRNKYRGDFIQVINRAEQKDQARQHKFCTH
jgi:hypothetical protein